MKNLIIVIILGVAGYFGYQYYMGASQQDSNASKPTFNMYSLPDKCQSAGNNMEKAFHQHMKGEIVKAQINGYTTHFRGCLRRAGYTDSQIDEAYNGIADSAGYDKW